MVPEPSKQTSGSNDAEKEKKIYDHQLVRTDSKEQKLEAFFSSPRMESSKSKDEEHKKKNQEAENTCKRLALINKILMLFTKTHKCYSLII